MGTLRIMQPSLMHVPVESDVVYTPAELAQDIINFYQPNGVCLDPCAGNGAFLNLLPDGSEWCEITQERDFYAWDTPVEWAVSNPPFSHYSAWLRHSMTVAKNIVYLIPLYKVFTSGKMADDLFSWGGIVHIRRYGTGTEWGFPFGQALSAAHFQRGYAGATSWSKYER
jgi:hypothetical protein